MVIKKMNDVNLLISNGVNVEKSLELLGNMETYNETLVDFLNAIFEKMTKIKLYKDSLNMPDYAILVHSLKSDARYLGFDKLANISYQHELESKANNSSYVNNNFKELANEAGRVVILVQEYLGKKPVSKQDTNVNPVEIIDNALLVVDDSDLMQNFIEKLFRDKFQVIMAKDGKEAIDLVKGNNNDKIQGMLLDLNMPNVNGFEVLEYFRNNNLFNIIPVSIITGSDSKEIITKAFNYPIVDMITKPFTESSVKTIVEKTVANKNN